MLRSSLIFAAMMIFTLCLGSCRRSDDKIVGEEVAKLTDAPDVPPPITRDHPSKVIVNLETREIVGQLAEGVKYTFWTFGGSVPGKFIRVREGDLVEIHLSNFPDDKMPHNIDLHAVTGPGGGATSSFTAPGHTSIFSFKALNPGLYIYHCAMAPVGMHIANGMYGLILVQPKKALPKVDHEYYVMQSEFYTKGETGQSGLQAFSMEKALQEKPDYVVFNGHQGALLDAKALNAKVGERIRLYVGNAGPNLTSSFHVIGAIFDKVYKEAGTATSQNVQTTSIPPGGAAIVEVGLKVPGTYVMVDHAIFRAFNKGAMGQIEVTGPEVKEIYSGKTGDEIYNPPAGPGLAAHEMAPAKTVAQNKNQRVQFGEMVFKKNCVACHQVGGTGIPHAFPPLAGSDFLNKDKFRALRVVTHGLTGEVTVNGNKYNGVMPAWTSLSDEDIANVLTYVYSSWGNSGKAVAPDEVKKARADMVSSLNHSGNHGG